MKSVINRTPDYLPRLISYNKKLSGLVGFVDFDLLQIENHDKETNSEPICKPLASAPYLWVSKLGSITLGCFSRMRKIGDIIAHPKNGKQILSYTGNLEHRSNDLLRILTGDEFLIKELNEIFSLVLWNQNKNEISLVTDRYGNLPIYYQYENNRLIFGSEVKTILLISGQSATLNREVLGELLWFGCPLTEQTLFQGIIKVPPATILRFKLGSENEEKYWNLKFSNVCSDDRMILLDITEQSFRSAIKRACSIPAKNAIALTGGIDTRIMLAEVLNLGIPVDAFTTGIANSADLKTATRLNRFVNGKHHRCIINRDFLKDFEDYARELVWLSEGGILLQDNQLIYLNQWCSKRFDVLVDGGCIEISKRGPLRRISQALRPNDNLCEFLIHKWGSDQLPYMLFDPAEFKLIENKIHQTLEKLLFQTRQHEIGDSIDALFLRVVWPNRYAPQIALQNDYLIGQLPFLDYDFMDAILQIDCSWREQCMFHFYVVNKNAPKLKQFGRVFCDLLIPWTDNYYLRYVFPALNLIWRRVGLPSFERPNFPYRIWWRKQLKGKIEQAFNSLAQRAILNPKGFAEILKPENINSNIYDNAVSRLWTLELWCRHFLDSHE